MFEDVFEEVVRKRVCEKSTANKSQDRSQPELWGQIEIVWTCSSIFVLLEADAGRFRFAARRASLSSLTCLGHGYAGAGRVH